MRCLILSTWAATLLKSSLQCRLVQTPAYQHQPGEPLSPIPALLLLLLLLEVLPSGPWCNIIQVIDSLEQVHPVTA
jgi:hypothetical protein